MRCFLEISQLYMRRSITHLQVCIRNGIPRMDCDIAHNVGQCLIPEQNHQPTRNYKKFISNDIHFFQSKTHGFPRILGGFPITKKKEPTNRRASVASAKARCAARRSAPRRGQRATRSHVSSTRNARWWERRLDDSSHQRVGFTCNEWMWSHTKRMLA